MNRTLHYIFGFIGIAILFSYCSINQSEPDLVKGTYWKDQVIQDILPYWTENARDTLNGGFFTTLDSAWNPIGDTRKYPSMLSRHLFGYSVGYLLSGDEKYLSIARETLTFLLTHAWDQEYGGWYDVLDEKGNPLKTTKSMFIQVYSITGLTMYYFVTRDKSVLSYIEKSNDLIESKAWDPDSGGYYHNLTRDWQVLDSTKSISSEITPVSGYLLYLYLATREKKYLDQCKRILETVQSRMIDPETGWVLESFNRNWSYIPRAQDSTEISIGHTIEVAWMFYRLFEISGIESYRKCADSLTNRICTFGNAPEVSFWYNTVGRKDPQLHSDKTYWWVQAYGNMFDLYSYHSSGQGKYLDHFRKGAAFWKDYFIDKKWGDTQFSVRVSGEVTESLKANQYKASYHTAENGMLNYFYLNAWVTGEPIELYFKLTDYESDIPFYPIPIEGDALRIKQVIADPEIQYSLTEDQQGIKSGLIKNGMFRVVLQRR